MDIDIDVANRDILLSKLPHRVASLNNGKKHNTGIYVTEIPHNPIDGVSSIDYKSAEQRGYFKIDILNVSIYNDVKDKKHLEQLMNTDPPWEKLQNVNFVDKIFQLSGHSELLKQMQPKSVIQLAMVLALIRPAKKHLIGKTWDEIKKEIWTKPTNGEYYFKKSHAVSYAMAVVVHMNVINNQEGGFLTN